jgi:hypothetical protein
LALSLGLILVASGVITAGAGLAALLSPRLFLWFGFGVESPHNSTVFLVRHWGVLIALVGVLVVYSAGDAAIRTPVLIAAAVEKIALGSLIFYGSVKPTIIVKAAAIGDCLLAILYVTYVTG